DHLGVRGRRELDAFAGKLVPQLRGIDEVAVVTERAGSRAPMVDERLRVLPVARPRLRVARVADRDLPVQAAQFLLVEDLCDEAEVAQDSQASRVGDRDPPGFLAAVLEREESEVGDARDVAAGRADAEHAAHQAPPSMIRNEAQSSLDGSAHAITAESPSGRANERNGADRHRNATSAALLESDASATASINVSPGSGAAGIVRTSSTMPTQPTTGVGGIARPSVSL